MQYASGVKYEGDWKENKIEGNGELKRLNENFKLLAKFMKNKIVGEFKVIINNDKEIVGMV